MLPVSRFLLLPAVLLALAACKGKAPDASGWSSASGVLRLRPVSIMDTADGNHIAYTLLVPAGWGHRASVEWNLKSANLASPSVRVEQPGGGGGFQVYPIVTYLWLEVAGKGLPEGDYYMGGMPQRPVEDPSGYVRRFLIPRYRPGIESLQVVRDEPLPGLAGQVWRANYNSDRDIRVNASRLAVRYLEGGRWYEEAFYCVLSFATSAKLPGSAIWRPEMLYSIRNGSGPLDSLEPVLMAVAGSLTVDRGWFSHYLGVRRKWVADQMESIRSAGEMSRYISMSNDEISTFITTGYQAQHASQDRLRNLYGETLRGVRTYTNPYSGNAVRLPSGYAHAWVSAGGEYLLANGDAYDPKSGTPPDWRPLEGAL